MLTRSRVLAFLFKRLFLSGVLFYLAIEQVGAGSENVLREKELEKTAVEKEIFENVGRIARISQQKEGSSSESCQCRSIAEACNSWPQWNDYSPATERRLAKLLPDLCMVAPGDTKNFPKDLFFDSYTLRNVCAINTYVRSHEALCVNVYNSASCLTAFESLIAEHPQDRVLVDYLRPMVESTEKCWKVKQLSEIEVLTQKNSKLILKLKELEEQIVRLGGLKSESKSRNISSTPEEIK